MRLSQASFHLERVGLGTPTWETHRELSVLIFQLSNLASGLGFSEEEHLGGCPVPPPADSPLLSVSPGPRSEFSAECSSGDQRVRSDFSSQ